MVSAATPRGFGGLAVPPKTMPARGVARRLHPGEVEARPPKVLEGTRGAARHDSQDGDPLGSPRQVSGSALWPSLGPESRPARE